jgi:hypothetical protein
MKKAHENPPSSASAGCQLDGRAGGLPGCVPDGALVAAVDIDEIEASPFVFGGRPIERETTL